MKKSSQCHNTQIHILISLTSKAGSDITMKTFLIIFLISLIGFVLIKAQREIRIGYYGSTSGLSDQLPAMLKAIRDYQAKGYLSEYTFRLVIHFVCFLPNRNITVVEIC